MADRGHLIAGVIAGVVMLLLLAYAGMAFWMWAAPWQMHATVIGLCTLPLAFLILTRKSSMLIEATAASCALLILLGALAWVSGWWLAAWLAGGSALFVAFWACAWCILLLDCHESERSSP